VKHAERSVTLRSSAVLRAVYDFLAHRAANDPQHWKLRFRFSTTATIASERPAVLSTLAEAEQVGILGAGIDLATPGIELWQKIQSGDFAPSVRDLIVSQIRREFRDGKKKGKNGRKKPKHILEKSWQNIQTHLNNDQTDAFLDVMRDFEFSTGETSGERLRGVIERRLIQQGLAANATVAPRLYEHLFTHVFRLLSNKNLKRLTLETLKRESQIDSGETSRLLSAFEHFLNEEANDRLSALRHVWREGRYREVENELARLRRPERWSLLDNARKVAVLTMACKLELQLHRDLDVAREHAQAVEDLGGDAVLLRAYIADHSGHAADALALLRDRTDQPAEHARAAIRLAGGEYDVGEPLEALIREGRGTAETHRLLALASLSKKDTAGARRHIDSALTAEDVDESVRLAEAMVTYHEALSPAVPDGLLTEPLPILAALVRQDDGSVAGLARAAAVFAQAVQTSAGAPERDRWLSRWRLACLANHLDHLAPAAMLARELLLQSPEDPVIIGWVFARELEVDLGPSGKALESRLQCGTGDMNDVQSLIWVHLAGGDAEATRIALEAHRSVFEAGDASEVYEHLLAGFTAPAEERLQLPAALATAVQGEQVAEALQAATRLASDGEWGAIGPFATWLAERAQTFRGLQLGAYAAFNTEDFAGCRALLAAHGACCPGGRLPPDLRRLLAEALARTGDLPGAVREAETVVSEAPTEAHVELLARLLNALGDDARLRVTVQDRLDVIAGNPGLLLELASVLQDRDGELARRLWRRAAEARIPDPLLGRAASIGLGLGLGKEIAPLFVRAQILGPDVDTGMLFGTFDTPAQADDVDPRAALTEDDLRAVVSGQQDQLRLGNDAYARGQLPAHFAFEGTPLLAHWLRTLEDREADPEPDLGWLGRHGSRGTPPAYPAVQRLFLDGTAFVTAAHFNLLDELEGAFRPLQVTPFLMLALEEAIRAQRPIPNTELELAQQVLRAVRSKAILVVSDATAPDARLAPLGEAWDQLLPVARETAGQVVDDIAVRLHGRQLDADQFADAVHAAVHPEAVLRALTQDGQVDADQVERAQASLWSAVGPSRNLPAAGQVLAVTRSALDLLTRVGLLEPTAQYFDIVISAAAAQHYDEVLAQEDRKSAILRRLERLRDQLRTGIDDKRYSVIAHPRGWAQRHSDPVRNDLEMLVATDFGPTDALWVEDRCISMWRRAGEGVTWTLTDVLAELSRRGLITDLRRKALVRQQRTAGLGLIPTSSDEFERLLREAPVRNEILRLTPGLKAWLKHVQSVQRFAPSLQRPSGAMPGAHPAGEVGFVIKLAQAALDTLRALWTRDVDSDTGARATWLASHAPLDVVGFLQGAQPNTHRCEGRLVATEAVLATRMVDKVPPGEKRQAYLAWWTSYFLDSDRLDLESLALAFQHQLVGELKRAPAWSRLKDRRQWLDEQLRELPMVLREQLRADVILASLTPEEQPLFSKHFG
jgi:hypothetical protein